MIVTSLEGVQYLKNLESLEIATPSDLSDIKAISNLGNLKVISLENKEINDLTPLKNLINLKSVNINGNPIYDISVLKSLKSLRSGYNLHVTDNNIYFRTCFRPAVIQNGKYYLANNWVLTVDKDGILYGSLDLVLNLLNASKNDFTILKSDNPYIDGVINLKNKNYKIESNTIYTSIENSYIEGKITNEDSTLSYNYSLKPNGEKGAIKLEENINDYLYSINDIFSTFGIKFSVEFDKDKKLCGFKFE